MSPLAIRSMLPPEVAFPEMPSPAFPRVMLPPSVQLKICRPASWVPLMTMSPMVAGAPNSSSCQRPTMILKFSAFKLPSTVMFFAASMFMPSMTSMFAALTLPSRAMSQTHKAVWSATLTSPDWLMTLMPPSVETCAPSSVMSRLASTKISYLAFSVLGAISLPLTTLRTSTLPTPLFMVIEPSVDATALRTRMSLSAARITPSVPSSAPETSIAPCLALIVATPLELTAPATTALRPARTTAELSASATVIAPSTLASLPAVRVASPSAAVTAPTTFRSLPA